MALPGGDVVHSGWIKWLLAAAYVLCAIAPAHAQLSINKLWVEFERGALPRTDLVIRNDSKDRYYITVKAFEIVEPGTEKEARVELADPEQLGLLVTPNRLVLEPGAARSVRLVSLNHGLTRDRVYRVLVTPQIGSIEGVARPKQDESALAVKLLAAYDVLVLARPEDPQPKIEATRTPGELTLRNVGNSNVLLSDGKVCPSEDARSPGDGDACKTLESVRLYPGNVLKIPLARASDIVTMQERYALKDNGKQIKF